MHPKFSVIIPVYNRPQEVDELLQSLTQQTMQDFEVIIVEDGSKITSKDVVEKYSNRLSIQYHYKNNTGPGPSRNYGYAQAKGHYLVVFDSDCIIPPDYFKVVTEALNEFHWDAWGGPDKAHNNFTTVQRAMGYTMSSFLTTGGIRGGKKRMGWFQPRSFNMGISKAVFVQTGGFKFDRYAEDIEFSIRMKNAGFKVGLIPEAFVFHKRRTDLIQFFKQVSNFGKGRILIGKLYPSEVKITHWIPALFTIGLVLIPLTAFIDYRLFFLSITGLILYLTAILFHSFAVNKSLSVALLSVPSAVIQLTGYGFGFLTEKFKNLHT